MTRENRPIWVVGLVLTILLLANLAHTSQLRADLEALRRELSGQKQDMAHVRTYLTNTLERRISDLDRELRWVRGLSMEVLVEEARPGEAVPVEIAWAFREIGQEAEVELQYREDEEATWRSQGATEEAGSFSARVELSPDHSWRYRVSARYDGITRKSEEFSLNLRDQVSGSFMVRSVTRGEEGEVEVYVVEKRGVYQLPWLEAESLHLDYQYQGESHRYDLEPHGSRPGFAWRFAGTIPAGARAELSVVYRDGHVETVDLHLDDSPVEGEMIIRRGF